MWQLLTRKMATQGWRRKTTTLDIILEHQIRTQFFGSHHLTSEDILHCFSFPLSHSLLWTPTLPSLLVSHS